MCVEEKFKFFINYDIWLQQFSCHLGNYHVENVEDSSHHDLNHDVKVLQ